MRRTRKSIFSLNNRFLYRTVGAAKYDKPEMSKDDIKYTWGLIYCPETKQILLLNRQKAPWMGRWNGVGGKLDKDEIPLSCIIRETEEETGMRLEQYKSRGVMKWKNGEQDLGGMYLFTAEVDAQKVAEYTTPRVVNGEGILDWKKTDWILHDSNSGVVDNVQVLLYTLFQASEDAEYCVVYEKGKLLSFDYKDDKHRIETNSKGNSTIRNV